MVLTEVMGTSTPAADGSSLGVFEIRLALFVRNLIVGGIDFHQHCARLHILIVLDVKL